MKKLFLVSMLAIGMLFAINTESNAQKWRVGLGAVDFRGEGQIGMDMSLGLGNFYFGFAGNLTSQRGEYLDFSSGYTYDTGEDNLNVFNFGWFFNVGDRFSVVPYLGFAQKSDIYQDTYMYDTYFYGDKTTTFNAGGQVYYTLVYFPNSSISVYGGMSIAETWKAGLSLDF